MAMTETVAPVGSYANIPVAGTVGFQNHGPSDVFVFIGPAAPADDDLSMLFRNGERDTLADITAGDTIWIKVAGTTSTPTVTGQDSTMASPSRCVVWS